LSVMEMTMESARSSCSLSRHLINHMGNLCVAHGLCIQGRCG
jgi:hypothetical protein